MPSRFYRFIQHPRGSKVALGLLVVLSLAYVLAARNFLYSTVFAPAVAISEHQMDASPAAEIGYWTAANMSSAIDADLSLSAPSDFSQGNVSAGKAAQQQGQAPSDSSLGYPLSTVGKIFFSDSSGLDYVCSGTAVISANGSVVDTAGHCLYWHNSWSQNVIFCPLYDHGNTPFGCWAARALEVPSDWIDDQPYDLHHDFGMAIVAPNSAGKLTDVVGGVGWAYNQASTQTFYAYGYPAARPFDGQSRQSCGPATGKSWKHGGGTVVSIPCDMTGGSSGGPWFIQIAGHWYLNGHNDFGSSIQPDHMFSPYYDDTWYAMYEKAENT
jgi:V8-like Glu-specific endopeptidase